MKTVVFQSHTVKKLPAWITHLMGLTKQWAITHGHDYRFIDDSILETVPDWYRLRVGSQMVINTDLARIQRARLLLDSGYERAVWIDADVLIFDPQNFSIAIDEPYAFCTEIWLRPSAKGIAWKRNINNAVCVYKKGNAFMDFYEHACLRLVADPKVALTRTIVGPELLGKLNAAMRLPVLTNVACFSPHVMADIAKGEGRYLKLHRQLFGSPIQAANLCASHVAPTDLVRQPGIGAYINETAINRAIETLLQTQGKIVSMLPPPIKPARETS